MPPTLGRRRKQAKLSAPVALTGDENDGLLLTDALYEVLLRVPAKELCRLRLVCRSWRSLTSDPGFARAHASRHPLLAAGIWNGTEVHLLDLMSCGNNIVRRFHVPQRVYDMSTDHGLLCVSPVIGCRLSYVLDPVAAAGEGAFATLPDGADDVDFQQDFDIDDVAEVVPDRASLFRFSSPSLLGHVPSTGEYKALRINGYCTGWEGGLLNQVRITQTCNVITVTDAATAASGGGAIRWRERPCPPVGRQIRERVVVDGVAYFLRRASCYSNHVGKYSKDMEPDAIFAFDLATEKWRPNTLRGPLSSNTNSDNELEFFSGQRESLQLCVLDGWLVTAHHKNLDCSMDLWFLEDMDDMDRELWTKRYSIQCVPGCKGRHSSRRPPCPLHVLEDGRIVIWGAEQERVLGVYDPGTNMYAKLASMEEYGSVRMHLGSLLCSSSLQS